MATDPRRAPPGTVALYTAAVLVGAALVFLTQPMVVRMVLPRLGGSPSVWNTAMVFFQAVLLAGYGYAHLSTTRLGLRRQALGHLVVLALPLAVLPMALPAGWRPPTEGAQVGWLVWVLAVVAGLPYFVVTTASPLLQRWFSVSGHRRSADPYFLYAAGNAGSIAGLVAYPLVVEPNLSLAGQARLWTAAYATFAGLSAVAALVVLRSGGSDRPDREAPDGGTPAATGSAVATGAAVGAGGLGAVAAGGLAPATAEGPAPAPTGRRREQLRWVLLAFVPSSLLLGVTTSLSTDVAAVPLLWVVPLTIYLLTSILAFARHRLFPVRLASTLTPVAISLVAATTLARAAHLLLATIAVQLTALFVVGMLCHGRLADSRPPPARLTEFFLCASLGGVAGGAFNALAAPLLFDRVLELPIALAAALLLRPTGRRTGVSHLRWRHREGRRRWPIARRGLHRVPPGRWRRPAATVLPLLAATAVVVLTVFVARERPQSTAALIGCCLAVAIVGLPSRVATAVALTGLLAYATVADDRSPLLRRRTFFGVLVVRDEGTRTTLSHGTTLHGSQLDDPGLAAVPTTYYHRSGPLGQVFAAYRASPLLDEVGVVGLGTGTVAAYAEEGRHLTYFEIDPAVVDIAEDPRLFTYLDAARRRADVDVVLGDARLSLADAPDGHFGLLVLDAFSSDAIPVHLLTREAVELYHRKVAPGGVVVVHISNRWLRLEGPLAAIADDLGLAALTANDGAVTPEQRREDKAASSWVALAGDQAALAPLSAGGGWRPAQREDGVAAWTDDFSNVVEVVRWRWWR